MNKELKNMKL